ncbi:TadE/TadG family type IV pilus assembly protein [Bradyrhizobium icense]|uniref:Pilus assembly protein TadG n=1 Tax=Bradyrhizobium icense TaxID=1274631 RepID=A0A1B1UTM2_9BRAD|nr:TadE/TadG family type IV pilus assembly protein [Bradyrhizobium icense]ANW06129.1 pilus assembly protein TadG [Bradyrhizobium icense]
MPSSIWLSRLRRHVAALRRNNSGLAAVEFAMIIPLMAMLFLGTYEFSTGVAIDRKVTIMARTLSDLTSQNTEVDDAKLTNFFNAGKSIMTPYSSTPVQGTISELWINPDTLKARVQWSKGAELHADGTIIEIPDALKIGGTYLIYSEVKYKYVPSVAWFINKVSGITLSDVSYTRPRQGLCVKYKTDCTTK